MKVLIFGATGMVGQGALREALKDSDVEIVQAVGRTEVKNEDPKFEQILHTDMWDYSRLESDLRGFDACFFCLGTPSSGKSEEEYRRITYDLTMAAAKTLSELNPGMTFIYISGMGADSTEKGSVMWARVRGKLENDLRKLPFKAVYIFRPGMIQALDGIESKTALYRNMYKAIWPLINLSRKLFPNTVASTRSIGQALLSVAKRGYPKPILEPADFEKAIRQN